MMSVVVRKFALPLLGVVTAAFVFSLSLFAVAALYGWGAVRLISCVFGEP